MANTFAAYVWVDKPDGKRTRKYVYGKNPRRGPRQVDQIAEPGGHRPGLGKKRLDRLQGRDVQGRQQGPSPATVLRGRPVTGSTPCTS